MNNKNFICKYCKKEYKDPGNLALHEDVCVKNHNANHYKSTCKYCGKIFEKGSKSSVFSAVKAHELCCLKNPDNNNCVCEKCNSKFRTQLGLIKHIKKCTGIKKQKNKRTCCIFCNKEILNAGSLSSHEKYCKLNPNKSERKIYRHHKKTVRKAWNKGLSAETSEKIKILSINIKKNIEKLKKEGKYINTGKASTFEKEQERRRKISEKMKINPMAGGKRHGSGRGKKGWYKGYYCDSSWELAFVVYNLEHNIKFQRNQIGFEYQYKNKKHKFYPDFILEDKTYVEIKGAMTEQNKIKISSFNGKLQVIDKNEIKPYLDYVIKKYGKNYTNLYENIEKL